MWYFIICTSIRYTFPFINKEKKIKSLARNKKGTSTRNRKIWLAGSLVTSTHNLAGLSRQHVIPRLSGEHPAGRTAAQQTAQQKLESMERALLCVQAILFLWNNGLAHNRSFASFNNVTPVSLKKCTSGLDKETTRTHRIQTGSWCPDLLPRQSHTHHFTRTNVKKWLWVSIIVFLLTTFLVRHSTYIVTRWITRPQKTLGRGQQCTTATTNQPLRRASGHSFCWGVTPILRSLKFRDTRFLAFLKRTFHSLYSIFDFPIWLRISWRGGGVIERPALRECFELFRRKLLAIVRNQNLQYAKMCKNGFQLANHDFCRDSMQTGNLDDIAEVIGHNKKGASIGLAQISSFFSPGLGTSCWRGGSLVCEVL